MSYKTKEEIIEYLKNYYNENNDIPKSTDKNHPFTKSRVENLFGGWNNALTESSIPLRINPKQLIICKNCNKEFKKLKNQIIKSENHFCSQSCSATYNNSKRVLTNETKQKISDKLKKTIIDKEKIEKEIKYKICIVCNKEHNLQRKTCSDMCFNILYPEINEDTNIYNTVNIESKFMLKTIWDILNDDFINIVKNSNSYSDILRKCGYTNLGNTNTVKKRIDLLNLSTDHFISIKPPNRKFKKSLNEIFIENNAMNGRDLKKRLINDLNWKYECNICKIVNWFDKLLPLELDHINGIHSDNRLENLRFLCPNCHSQTDTFRTKNKKKLDPIICNNCDNEINKSNKSGYCKECIPKFKKSNFKKPSLQELENDLKEFKCYDEIGNKYDVSGKCIQQWIRKYNQETIIEDFDNEIGKLKIDD